MISGEKEKQWENMVYQSKTMEFKQPSFYSQSSCKALWVFRKAIQIHSSPVLIGYRYCQVRSMLSTVMFYEAEISGQHKDRLGKLKAWNMGMKLGFRRMSCSFERHLLSLQLYLFKQFKQFIFFLSAVMYIQCSLRYLYMHTQNIRH